MNGVEIAIWAVVAFTLVYEPVFGYLDYRRFKRKAGTDDGARIRLYVRTMIGLWLPVLYILGVVGLTDVTLADIGFALPGFDTGPLGPPATYAVTALVSLYALALAYHGIGYRVSAAMRAKMDRLREERVGKAAFADMLPVTDRERKWWAAVSVTAGIAEEIIYRGFLFFAFSRLFPSLSVWGVILFTAVLFGLAHTYQGVAGVIRTGAVGAVFAMLFAVTGSILPLVVLHFLIDLMARAESGAKRAEAEGTRADANGTPHGGTPHGGTPHGDPLHGDPPHGGTLNG